MRDAACERPHTFYVPDPPQIPLDKYDPPVHWSEVSTGWTANLNKNKTGFKVSRHKPKKRRLKPRKRLGCKLGPPSLIPDWHPLIEKYGLRVLEAAGFINHTCTPIGDNMPGRLALAEWRNPKNDEELKIHPVLRYEMWSDLNPRVWHLIQPALRLASAILDDPATLNYFHALAAPSDQMDTVFHDTDGFTGHCKFLNIPDVLTQDEQEAVFRKMDAMRSWTSWSFKAAKDSVYGLTDVRRNSSNDGDLHASKPNTTTQSDITLNHKFIDVLDWYEQSVKTGDQRHRQIFRDIYSMAGIKPDHQATITTGSAIYRTLLMLATTIVHEFTHAFTMAWFEVSKDLNEPYEPWVRGNRSNEQGSSFESYIYGGQFLPYTLSLPPTSLEFDELQFMVVPFGFYTQQQWDAWEWNTDFSPDFRSENSNESDGPGDSVNDGPIIIDDQDPPEVPPQRYFPVPQAWCESFFSDDLWTSQVDAYGLDAIKIPKHKKWEVIRYYSGYRGVWNTGEERWNRADDDLVYDSDGDVRIPGPNWD